MKMNCIWNGGMKFTADSGGNSVLMDANRPIGTGTALTPKALVLAGVCGCTAMDVAALMKKHRQPMDKFEISAEVTALTEEHPKVFKEILLTYSVEGNVDAAKLVEAVKLSQTKYCSVSAMIAQTASIHYEVFLNAEKIDSDDSNFDI